MVGPSQRSIAIAPILSLVVLFGIVLVYHEDGTLLLADVVRVVGVGGGVENKGNDVMFLPAGNGTGGDNSDNDGEESSLWNALINAAVESNFTCGGDSHLPASIHATISAEDIQANIPSTKQNEGTFFIPFDFTFRAYDTDLRPKQVGGDMFVLDYQSSWPWEVDKDTNETKYKIFRSAAFSSDNLNGEYYARLFLPRALDQRLNISLRHYYTCFEGMLTSNQLKVPGSYHILDFGPLPWQKAVEEVHSALTYFHTDNGRANSSSSNHSLPLCSESLDDDILHGVWVDERLNNVTMTLNASWTPIRCSLDRWEPEHDVKNFRIGDSTMPGRPAKSFLFVDSVRWGPGIKVKTGVPYIPYSLAEGNRIMSADFINALHDFWLEYEESSSTDDTFLYSGGLHHIFHGGFNVHATTALVVRTLCQAGLVFPGHMLLRGPNPIQQHNFHVVDITSLNVRRLNWELHSRLQKSGQRLSDLCMSTPVEDLSNFVALPDNDGNIFPSVVADPVLVKEYNYSWKVNATADQQHLAEWMRGLSYEERSERYGNRTIRWINLEEFLLPWPEIYRTHDKIHDGPLFFGHEWDILSNIEQQVVRRSAY
ncbi:hypothetical protein ACHAWF_016110 [Thalassiosira exigua]